MVKNLFSILVLMLLVTTSVFAAERYTLDFNKQSAYEIGLAEGDAVEFFFNEARHIVQVKTIDFNQSTVELVSFLWVDEKKTPYYNIIGNGKVLKLDFEVDDVADVYVNLNKMNEDSVSLIFIKVNDAQSVDVGDFGDFIKHNRAFDVFVVAFFVIVLLIIVVLVAKRK